MYFSRATRTPRSGAQPRASTGIIDSKYEGRSCPPPRAMSSTSDAPGRSPAAGAPIASSTVGRRSTCRAGLVMVTPRRSAQSRPDFRDDQRHVQRRLVREDAVRHLAVFTEAFAVVGGHDHERRTGLSRRAASRSGPRASVGPRDLGGIRIGRILRLPLRRRPCKAHADRRRAPRRTTCRSGGRSSRVPTPTVSSARRSGTATPWSCRLR